MGQKKAFVLALILLSFTILRAQQQPPAPPQTARQALIEMVSGGEKSLTKHLTVETQEGFLKQGNASAKALPMTMVSAIANEAGSDFQSFDSGPVLFSVVDTKAHTKVEIRVDGEDLNGNEDTLQISYHAFRDGEEQTDEVGLLASQIQVSLKQQENIWRLNEITVTARFPVGNPEFLKKLLGGAAGGAVGGAGNGAVSEVHVSLDRDKDSQATGPVQTYALPPEQVVNMLGLAEGAFAGGHPEKGFTCSLAELAETSSAWGVDPQVANGSYNGYKFTLAGCEGNPAGSFQVIAEPIGPVAGLKAFCSDATHNVRVADDGRGSTCLTSGKVFKAESLGWTSSTLTTTEVKVVPQ
jgi:hypothetical protein